MAAPALWRMALRLRWLPLTRRTRQRPTPLTPQLGDSRPVLRPSGPHYRARRETSHRLRHLRPPAHQCRRQQTVPKRQLVPLLHRAASRPAVNPSDVLLPLPLRQEAAARRAQRDAGPPQMTHSPSTMNATSRSGTTADASEAVHPSAMAEGAVARSGTRARPCVALESQGAPRVRRPGERGTSGAGRFDEEPADSYGNLRPPDDAWSADTQCDAGTQGAAWTTLSASTNSQRPRRSSPTSSRSSRAAWATSRRRGTPRKRARRQSRPVRAAEGRLRPLLVPSSRSDAIPASQCCASRSRLQCRARSSPCD